MTSLELPRDLKAGLEAVKERDGIPQSEQIRRAIRAWLVERGVDVAKVAKAARKGSRA
jgi:hypothetical protein